LNTDLAKKPPEFLEYVVVHEMAHMIARYHDDRFARVMDRCLPNWKLLRQELNRTALSHLTDPSGATRQLVARSGPQSLRQEAVLCDGPAEMGNQNGNSG
jgi:hypothetical protein